MRIITKLPPNFEQIKKAIPMDNWDKIIKERGTLFTYGAGLYNPSNARIPEFLIPHEETHVRQQIPPRTSFFDKLLGLSVKKWWDKYLNDKEFRFSMELEAYINEYKFVVEKKYPSKLKEELLNSFARDLASEEYGNLIDQSKAKSLIRHGANESETCITS